MKNHTCPVIFFLVLILLTACSANRYVSRGENQYLKAAKAELREVDKALRMYQAASPDTAFPEEEQIQSYLDLWMVALPYVKLPAEVTTHWRFISYQRPSPGVYMIQASVRPPHTLFYAMSMESGGKVILSEGWEPPPPN